MREDHPTICSRLSRDTAKLFVTHAVLQARARRPEAFRGSYTPVEAGDDACAFLRGDDVLVVAALRGVPEAAVRLPSGGWTSALTKTATRVTFQAGTLGAQFSGTIWFDDITIE